MNRTYPHLNRTYPNYSSHGHNDINFLERCYRLVNTAIIWRDAAEKVILSAERASQTLNPSNDGLLALNLVSEIFKIKNNSNGSESYCSDAGNAFAKIKKTFQDMGLVLTAFKNRQLGFFLAQTPYPLGIPLNANAYSFTNSWFAKKSDNQGLWFVRTVVQNFSDDDVVDLIIHETAHIVGIGHFIINKEVAYNKAALGISLADALNNASSYAWLAYQARKPKEQWLNFN